MSNQSPKRERASIARSGVRATRVASSHGSEAPRSDSEELLEIIFPLLTCDEGPGALGTRMGRMRTVQQTWPARVNVELLIQHVGLSVSLCKSQRF
jgi:hypothetical protein